MNLTKTLKPISIAGLLSASLTTTSCDQAGERQAHESTDHAVAVENRGSQPGRVDLDNIEGRVSQASGQDQEELVRQWAEAAPMQAFSWLANTDQMDRYRKESLMMELIKKLTPGHATEVARVIETLNAGQFRSKLSFVYLENLIELDPKRALTYAKELAAKSSLPSGSFLLVSQLVQNGGLNEAVALLEHLPTSERYRGMQELMGLWVNMNFDQAWDFYEKIPDNEKRVALYPISFDLAKRSPALALEQVKYLPDERAESTYLKAVGAAIFQREKGVNWKLVDELPPAQRSTLVGGIYQEWAATDLNTALSHALTKAPDAHVSPALKSITAANANDHPALLAREIAAHSDRPGAAAQLTPVGMTWATYDHREALSFADTLPPGEGRDSLLFGIVQSRHFSDPNSPLRQEVISRIEDPGLRSRLE